MWACEGSWDIVSGCVGEVGDACVFERVLASCYYVLFLYCIIVIDLICYILFLVCFHSFRNYFYLFSFFIFSISLFIVKGFIYTFRSLVSR